MAQAATTPATPSNPATPATAASDAVAVQARLVDEAIQEISHIATLPEVTLKIIRLVEDPDSTAHDLNRVITNDPALGARILKVVNSAFYGLPGQIGSINRAIVLLGLNAVKNIAIAASLAKLFRGGRITPNFNARDLWSHSVACASATRLLAKHVGLGLPDEAFLAGLIHDIGILVEMQARRPKFTQALELLETNPEMTLRQAEQQCLGADHQHFGAGLCRAWKFPSSFAYVTGFHHHPMTLPEKNRTLTGLVTIADIITAQQEIGFTRSVETTALPAELMDWLKLSRASVDEVTMSLPEAMAESEALFSDVVG
ncbi:MAG: HDOD domain-containing protein [Phycisphaeraceae bacterium]